MIIQDWNAAVFNTDFAIAVYVNAMLNTLEQSAIAPRSLQIVLAPIVKLWTRTRTKCVQDMESAIAISVIVKQVILGSFAKVLQGTKHIIHFVSFMKHVCNVLLGENSN